ncbi:hypothetical protein GWI33_001603 [Rhynchophorus ferrugineus]|uniref:Uncharacterized protein n=1 Tax=Rhynchophorus ferrugineus TaxID=354439 RepID=A0A834HLN9_RHYFE|nr:hypothetical protein GWI33_001603 [Rhynchophorus ferrugineus]
MEPNFANKTLYRSIYNETDKYLGIGSSQIKTYRLNYPPVLDLFDRAGTSEMEVSAARLVLYGESGEFTSWQLARVHLPGVLDDVRLAILEKN